MLRRLLPLAFVTLGLTAPMASVAAQPFTQGAAGSAISAANALSARIRGYHRWQGLTQPPAGCCATMREGEGELQQRFCHRGRGEISGEARMVCNCRGVA